MSVEVERNKGASAALAHCICPSLLSPLVRFPRAHGERDLLALVTACRSLILCLITRLGTDGRVDSVRVPGQRGVETREGGP